MMTYLERPAWMADLHWEQCPADISQRDVAWAKLAAMAEGAALASQRLWK